MCVDNEVKQVEVFFFLFSFQLFRTHSVAANNCCWVVNIVIWLKLMFFNRVQQFQSIFYFLKPTFRQIEALFQYYYGCSYRNRHNYWKVQSLANKKKLKKLEKIFSELPLSSPLAKTLRANKIVMKSCSRSSFVVDNKL